MLYRSCLIALCTLVAVCATPTMALPGLQWLGDLAGGTFYSSASGISADGRTIVGSSSSAASGSGSQEAFIWTAAGGMQGLGSLDTVNFDSWASAVSSDGSVVVGATNTAAGQRPFRWTQSGGMQELGQLPIGGSGPFGYAQAVSPDGSTVVGVSGASFGWEAFAWTAGGGIASLGGEWSSAKGISSGGLIVGSTLIRHPWSTRGFTWTAGGGMQLIGLARPGDTDSEAIGVTGDGQYIIGTSGAGNDFRPFRWQQVSGFELLGDVKARPWAISADGSAIVGVSYTNATDEAFLWRSSSGMVGLKPYLAAQFGWNMQDWQLLEATATSADGRCIAGNGIGPNGATEAFLIKLPHPADATLDGVVNVDDLGVLASNYGLNGAPWIRGDFTGDGVVNVDDLGVLASNYGWADAGSQSNIPEPATLALLLPALLLRRRS